MPVLDSPKKLPMFLKPWKQWLGLAALSVPLMDGTTHDDRTWSGDSCRSLQVWARSCLSKVRSTPTDSKGLKATSMDHRPWFATYFLQEICPFFRVACIHAHHLWLAGKQCETTDFGMYIIYGHLPLSDLAAAQGWSTTLSWCVLRNKNLRPGELTQDSALAWLEVTSH